ncbi:hypothetical protein JVU11DRAFT_9775 [Chiua virens]|nr:hypothetical protein JVU11DRAFT_9775 [Chiua virens]
MVTSGLHRFVINSYSLGGALATSLASLSSPPRPSKLIASLPIPSPGTPGLVDRFSEALPTPRTTTERGGYQIWNLDLIKLDIVPYAPSKCPAQNLDRLLELHPDGLWEDSFIFSNSTLQSPLGR